MDGTYSADIDNWVQEQLEAGLFRSRDEALRAAIEAFEVQQTTPAEISQVRSALREAEEAGFTDRSIEEIFEDCKARLRRDGRL